jgi:hypothetical protein
MPRHLTLFFSLSLGLAGATAVAAPAAKKAGSAKRAPYSTPVTRLDPLGVGIIVDHSGSNRKAIAGGDLTRTKAFAIAQAVNTNLEAMVVVSQDGESPDTGEPKFKEYFHVLGMGYSTGVRPLIGNAIEMLPVSKLVEHGKWVDQNGQPVTRHEDYATAQMHWVDAVHEGATHTGEALEAALPHFQAWVKANPNAPAPVVLHFSDGAPEGGMGNHMRAAEALKALKTKDGNLVLMNVHVGESGGQHMFLNEKQLKVAIERAAPEEADALRRMFIMSSPMPAPMIARARESFPEFEIHDDARAMVVNASDSTLAKLLEMGTIQNLAK